MLVATVSHQRSGTKFFASLLATGTQVAPRGELFYPDANLPNSFLWYLDRKGLQQSLQLSSDLLLDEFFQSLAGDNKISHFDLMFNQLEVPCIGWNGFTPDRFIYGYLKSRRAVVLSLERDLTDVYKSMLRVEAGRPSHYYVDQPDDLHAAPVAITIDPEHQSAFRLSLLKQRLELWQAFKDYPYFVRIHYSEFAKLGRVPDSVTEQIASCAQELNIPFDPTALQLGGSGYRPTPKDVIFRE